MTAQRSNGRRTQTTHAGLADHVHDVGERAEHVARSAGMPAMAAAATLAGLAAGLTLGRRRSRGVLRLRGRRTARDLADAARGAQSAACQMGELAAEIRKVREQAGSMNRRSPIEVVLQGLTRRPEH